MKNITSKTFVVLWIGLLLLPLQTRSQQLWDGGGLDLEWTNNLNWTCSAGGTCDNRAPNEWDTCNFTGTVPEQTNIYVSVDSAAARIQMRANSTGPRTLQIGINALTDVTLRVSGNGVPSLLNQQGNAAAEEMSLE